MPPRLKRPRRRSSVGARAVEGAGDRPRSRARDRDGFTLAELLVAAVAGGLVLAGLAALLAAQARVTGAHVERMRLAEGVRVPALVSAAELPFLVPGADVRVAGRGVLELRALRGLALPCPGAGEGVVRFRGLRQPEPEKDSVLVLTAGAEVATALTGSGPTGGPAVAGCAAGPGESLLRLTLTASVPPGAVLLLFESGSYHLEDRAFRYRRGAAGRQPLTETLLDTRRGGFALVAGPAVEVAVEAALAPPSGRRLSLRGRIPLLNAAGEIRAP